MESQRVGGSVADERHTGPGSWCGPLGEDIRKDFPYFEGERDREAVVAKAFLDSAASAQTPRVVIDRMSHYLAYEHANIHRGAYELSARATQLYDDAKDEVAKFLHAPSARNIVFTRGTTEAVNLVAYAYEHLFQPGDVILLTLLEHHSNIVPWQLLAKRKGLRIEFVNINDDATLDEADLFQKLRELKPKLLSITSISNAFGTVVPLEKVIPAAKESGALVFVDGAQGVVHGPVDVQALDVDFLAFSGHKVYGPTGIGVLYGKEKHFAVMEPFQGGGDMIAQVAVEGSTWAEYPRKFEAGTPAIAEAIGLAEALRYVGSIGFERLERYEQEVFAAGFKMLSREPGVTVYGPVTSGLPQSSILPFNLAGVHPHDMATIADSFGAQIRAGHHCAMPALKRLGLPSTARASIAAYSTVQDFEVLCEAIGHARKTFQ